MVELARVVRVNAAAGENAAAECRSDKPIASCVLSGAVARAEAISASEATSNYEWRVARLEPQSGASASLREDGAILTKVHVYVSTL